MRVYLQDVPPDCGCSRVSQAVILVCSHPRGFPCVLIARVFFFSLSWSWPSLPACLPATHTTPHLELSLPPLQKRPANEINPGKLNTLTFEYNSYSSSTQLGMLEEVGVGGRFRCAPDPRDPRGKKGTPASPPQQPARMLKLSVSSLWSTGHQKSSSFLFRSSEPLICITKHGISTHTSRAQLTANRCKLSGSGPTTYSRITVHMHQA